MNVRSSVTRLIQLVEKLQKQLRLPVSFRECGIDTGAYQKQVEAIITGAQRDACIATNPRSASRQEIKEILKRAW